MTDQPTTPDVDEALDAPEEPTTEPAALTPEAMSRELERARREAAKYRTRLREKEQAEAKAAEEKRQAELTAEQRATEAEQKAAKALEEAEARVKAAERKAALAGKVSNPDRVMRLMDDPNEYFDGANPKLDAILEAFPEYTNRPTAVGTSSKTTPTSSDGTPKTLADFEGKPQSYFEKHWDAFVAKHTT